MPHLKINDIDLYYEVTGNGPAIVLIAGGFCDHHVWDQVIPALSKHFQVITLDNRSSGLSGTSPGEYTAELLSNDVFALLNHLNIKQAHFVGHSMGGFVAQHFAAAHPEMVITLSLLSSILTMNDLGKDFLNNILVEAQTEPETLRERLTQIAGVTQTIPQIIQQTNLCKSYDARLFIKKIRAPTLVMSGREEPIMNIDETNLLAASIANVKTVKLLDCNHMLPLEMPENTTHAILDMINSCR